jgi:hypothetical protein
VALAALARLLALMDEMRPDRWSDRTRGRIRFFPHMRIVSLGRAARAW